MSKPRRSRRARRNRKPDRPERTAAPSRPDLLRPDLADRRPLAAMSAAEFLEWDRRTTLAALRAWATCRMLIGAKLARAHLARAEPLVPFCARDECLRHSTCLGPPAPETDGACPVCIAEALAREAPRWENPCERAAVRDMAGLPRNADDEGGGGS